MEDFTRVEVDKVVSFKAEVDGRKLTVLRDSRAEKMYVITLRDCEFIFRITNLHKQEFRSLQWTVNKFVNELSLPLVPLPCLVGSSAGVMVKNDSPFWPLHDYFSADVSELIVNYSGLKDPRNKIIDLVNLLEYTHFKSRAKQ